MAYSWIQIPVFTFSYQKLSISQLMKRHKKFLVATLASALTSILSASSQAEETPPNVIIILSDDQAWTDYGFMGHKVVKTPHLDKLAKKSVVYERGYVASPLCRPSLASILTGKQPFEHGISGNDVNGPNKRAEFDVPLRKAFHQHPTFVKELVKQGYLAHQSGKWWEGHFSAGGFTHGMTHGDPKRGGRHGDVGLEIGRNGMEPVTNFIDMAIEEKKPFLVWYAPFLPHTPHNPPKRLLDKYTEPDRAEDVAKYYAMCSWFDETCGTLLNHLDKKKISKNTFVLYICDNGWAATSSNLNDPHQKLWKRFAQRSKGSPFENGIRTPIMISWPKKLQAKKSQHFAHAIDLFPTVLAAAKAKAPIKLKGVNLLDEVAVAERKKIFGVCHAIHNMTPENTDETLKYLWSIEGDWKLMLRYPGKDTTGYRNVHVWDKNPIRLYNLKNDPAEKNELSAKYPEIVAKMKASIEAWHKVQ